MAPATARRIAQALFAKPHVAVTIAQVRKRAEEKLESTAERVLMELARIAFSDMADFCHWSDDGVEFVSSSDLPTGVSAAVKKVHCIESVSASGTVTRNVRIELHDKLGALLALAKHLGLDKPKEGPRALPLMIINTGSPVNPDRHRGN